MAGNRLLKANITAVIGASGSGKTTFVMREVKRIKSKRLMVWDTKGEFAAEGHGQAVSTMAEVVAILKKAGASGAFKICYKPRGGKLIKEEFSLFCFLAFAAKNLVFIGEELSEVTSPSHAPPGWRKITTQGRTEGLIIYGLSQFPAQIDKNFFGNCSRVRTGRLNFEDHIKTMKKIMGTDYDTILNLKIGEYIERDMTNGTVTRGNLF